MKDAFNMYTTASSNKNNSSSLVAVEPSLVIMSDS